jgi:putative transposase
MAVPIALREDFDGPGLRTLARATKDAAQARRLLALAQVYDGGSPTDAARIGGVTLQIVRDWVLRFNSRGPDALINRKAPGNRPKLNDEHVRFDERGRETERCHKAQATASVLDFTERSG